MKLISGKTIAADIRETLRQRIENLKEAEKRLPKLSVILVGDDPASATYVRNKERACAQTGILSETIRMSEDTTQQALLEVIRRLNADETVDGILVQLPLPRHIDEQAVLRAIDPDKDVDGFHPCNVGKMVTGLPAYLPATPAGIVELLKRYEIPTQGKHCVVIGRSNIVGTPMAVLMSRKDKYADCTVTICHSRTQNIKEMTLQADILIVALGKPHFVTADMVKEGAVVVDVGIHRIPSDKTKSGFRLVGDVDFEGVAPKCSYITPVPGGVGPMTIVSLLQNTLKACKGLADK